MSAMASLTMGAPFAPPVMYSFVQQRVVMESKYAVQIHNGLNAVRPQIASAVHPVPQRMKSVKIVGSKKWFVALMESGSLTGFVPVRVAALLGNKNL